VVGALVRAHGAGLACPDWPLCFGQLIPEIDLKVGFEFGHRVMAGGVSLALVALAVFVLRNAELRARYRVPLAAVFAILGVQIVLGGLTVLLGSLAAEPRLARLALIDAGAAGPAAQRRYRAALQRMTPFFDEGRDFAPGGRRLPANTSRMAIGAVIGLVSDEIDAGRADRLPGLLPEVLFAAMVPYLGPAAAAEEAGKK